MTKYFNEQERAAVQDAARLSLIGYYAKNGIKSRESVLRLVDKVLPVKASRKVMCGCEDHISQVDFLTEALTGNLDMYVLWANRAGSKTYFIALEAWLNCIMKKNLECLILGGSLEQSQKAYKATKDFWSIGRAYGDGSGNPMEKKYLLRPPMETKTNYRNNSSIEILTASQKSVRGPHPQWSFFDEVDVMDEEILQAALSGPQSKHGIPARVSMSSTNHIMGGLMDEQIEKARGNPKARIFKWCIWDVLEACTEYSCSTCDLSSHCPGKQMKQATGYYKINDFIQKLYQLSAFTLNIEWFCKKVGHPDLIYKNEFDEEVHFINYPFSNMKMGEISIDWGGINPFSLGYWQYSDELKAHVRIDEIIMNPDKDGAVINNKLIEAAKKKPWWNHISGGVGDPSRPDLIREWRESGVNIHPADNRVDVGIEKVKAALSPVLGKPKIYFSKLCANTRREFYSYKQKNGKPVKENDHSLDEIRYYTIWKIAEKSKQKAKVFEKSREDRQFLGGI